MTVTHPTEEESFSKALNEFKDTLKALDSSLQRQWLSSAGRLPSIFLQSTARRMKAMARSILGKAGSTPLAATTVEITKKPDALFLAVLMARDRLEIEIRNDRVALYQKLIELKDADDELWKIGKKILAKRNVNLMAWRQIVASSSETPGEALAWWWHIDSGDSWRAKQVTLRDLIVNTLRTGVWLTFNYGLPSALILVSVDYIFETAYRLATVARQLNANIDLFTVGSVLFQFLLNGTISIRVSQSLTLLANQQAREDDKPTRIGWFLPVHEFVIGTGVFLLIAIGARFIVDEVSDLMQEIRPPITAANLEPLMDAAALNRPGEYENELTLQAIQYEELGDYEQAQTIYQTLLIRNPGLIVTRYRLANIHIRNEEYDTALSLLDRGLEQLELYWKDPKMPETLELQIPEDNPNDAVIQLQYLYYVRRAKAFYQRGSMPLALDNLRSAEDILKMPSLSSVLFITRLNKRSADQYPNAIFTTELYYYKAMIYDIRSHDPSRSEDQRRADRDIAKTAWLEVQAGNQLDSRVNLWIEEANRRQREANKRP